MPRVKRGVTARARHKKVLALAKGYRGRRKNVYRIAKQAVMKAGQYAYRDRRQRKRQFRSLWIARINAAARELGMLEAGTSPVQIEVIGNHRPVAPIPSSLIASVAGMLLNTDTRVMKRHTRQEEGVEVPVVPLRMMPQEALYVRRERRIGSMLAADHSAHNTVPGLIVS